MLQKVKLSSRKLTHCVPTQGASICHITWLISALTLLVGYRKDIWPVKKSMPLIRKGSYPTQAEEETGETGYPGSPENDHKAEVVAYKTNAPCEYK